MLLSGFSIDCMNNKLTEAWTHVTIVLV